MLKYTQKGGNAAQWICLSDSGIAIVLKALNDAAPAGGIDKGTVYQNNSRLRRGIYVAGGGVSCKQDAKGKRAGSATSAGFVA